MKLASIGEAIDALKVLLDATDDHADRMKLSAAIVALDGDVDDEEASELPEREEASRAMAARFGREVPQSVHREGTAIVFPILSQDQARDRLRSR